MFFCCLLADGLLSQGINNAASCSQHGLNEKFYMCLYSTIVSLQAILIATIKPQGLNDTALAAATAVKATAVVPIDPQSCPAVPAAVPGSSTPTRPATGGGSGKTVGGFSGLGFCGVGFMVPIDPNSCPAAAE
jgi:hypothetical protein